MTQRYSRIRIFSPKDDSLLLIRDSLSITFYVQKPHREVAPLLIGSMETYLRVTGAHLEQFVSHDEHTGTWGRVDETAWTCIRADFLEHHSASLNLVDESLQERRYGIEYSGRSPGSAFWTPDDVCAVRYWLPTEYLDQHGPRRLSELALELLGALPICSGNAGLAFHGDWESQLRGALFSELVSRYPGMDVPDGCRTLGLTSGNRVEGISWMTFLGQPALGEVGGVVGLRARLLSPDTTIDELAGNRAVITLGEWPDSGDTHAGCLLPSYCQLAKALEPILYREGREHQQGLFSSPEELQRWQRRFLD